MRNSVVSAAKIWVVNPAEGEDVMAFVNFRTLGRGGAEDAVDRSEPTPKGFTQIVGAVVPVAVSYTHLTLPTILRV